MNGKNHETKSAVVVPILHDPCVTLRQPQPFREGTCRTDSLRSVGEFPESINELEVLNVQDTQKLFARIAARGSKTSLRFSSTGATAPTSGSNTRLLSLGFPWAANVVQKVVRLKRVSSEFAQVRKLYYEFQQQYAQQHYYFGRFVHPEVEAYHQQSLTLENYNQIRQSLVCLGLWNGMCFGNFSFQGLSPALQAQVIMWGGMVVMPMLLVFYETLKLSIAWTTRSQMIMIILALYILMLQCLAYSVLQQPSAITLAMLSSVVLLGSSSNLFCFSVGTFNGTTASLWLVIQLGTKSAARDFVPQTLTLVMIMVLGQYCTSATEREQRLISLEIWLSKKVGMALVKGENKVFRKQNAQVERRRSITTLFSQDTRIVKELNHNSETAMNRRRKSIVASIGDFVKQEVSEAKALGSNISDRLASNSSAQSSSRRSFRLQSNSSIVAFEAATQDYPSLFVKQQKTRLDVRVMKPVPAPTSTLNSRLKSRITKLSLHFQEEKLEEAFVRTYRSDKATQVIYLRLLLIMLQVTQAGVAYAIVPKLTLREFVSCFIVHGFAIMCYYLLPSPRELKQHSGPFLAHLGICSIEVSSKLLLCLLYPASNFYLLQLLLAYVILFTTTTRQWYLALLIAFVALLVQFIVVSFVRLENRLGDFAISLNTLAVVGIGAIACYRHETLLRIRFMLTHRRIERVQIMIDGATKLKPNA